MQFLLHLFQFFGNVKVFVVKIFPTLVGIAKIAIRMSFPSSLPNSFGSAKL